MPHKDKEIQKAAVVVVLPMMMLVVDMLGDSPTPAAHRSSPRANLDSNPTLELAEPAD